jgi:hypothetical protein
LKKYIGKKRKRSREEELQREEQEQKPEWEFFNTFPLLLTMTVMIH